MDSFQLLTNIYMLGLGCGIWSKKEIIDWCDKVIEAKMNPPYEIIEIALMSNAKIDDIEGKLFEISKQAINNYPVKLMLSVLNEKIHRNQIKIEIALKCSARLLVNTGLSCDSEYLNFDIIDDGYHLAVNGTYGNLNDVLDDYLVDMGAYSKYFSEFKKLYLDEMNKEWVS